MTIIKRKKIKNNIRLIFSNNGTLPCISFNDNHYHMYLWSLAFRGTKMNIRLDKWR